jgi:hypothetical protein
MGELFLILLYILTLPAEIRMHFYVFVSVVCDNIDYGK